EDDVEESLGDAAQAAALERGEVEGPVGEIDLIPGDGSDGDVHSGGVADGLGADDDGPARKLDAGADPERAEEARIGGQRVAIVELHAGRELVDAFEDGAEAREVAEEQAEQLRLVAFGVAGEDASADGGRVEAFASDAASH